MSSKYIIVLSFSTIFSMACGGAAQVPAYDDGLGNDAAQCEQGACVHSYECPVGQICGASGCCEAAGLGPLEFGRLESTCADQGCSCDILHAGGQTTPGGVPHFVLSDGGSRIIKAVLQMDGSGQVDRDLDLGLAEATFTLELTDASEPTSFTIEGSVVQGSATAGSATLIARFGDLAFCHAQLVNLGARPELDQARVHVFDAATGLPIPGAVVLLDADQDGIDDANAEPTDANGVTTGDLPLERAGLDVSVFAAGYDYLTVLGLAPERNEIALPLNRRHAEPVVAGTSGKIDFDTYAREVLGGYEGSISMAMVAASFPMASMVSFDLGVLLGGPVVDLDCDAGDPCYTFDIPGVLNEEVGAWGGMVLSLPTNDLKPHFDVVGSPGLRRMWSVGGQWEVGDLEELLVEVLLPPSPDCSCNREATCELDCSCDADCRISIESRFFRAITPLLSRAAFGVSPSHELASVPLSEWNAHLDNPYGERQANPSFAIFDDAVEGAAAGSVVLDRPLDSFSIIAVPALPPDPAGVGLGTMEGMFVVTGVELPGVGFVPSGLGTAFDCTDDVCAGHQRDPSSTGYDGHINGAEVCVADADARACPEGVPPVVADGQVGLFHAPQIEQGLGGQPRTVLLAVPVDSFESDAVRATAILIDGELPAGDVDWSGLEFPGFSSAEISGREVSMVAGEGVSVSRLELNNGDIGWTVLSADDSVTWLAPAVPAGLPDPLGQGAELTQTTTGYVLGGGQSLGELLENDGSTLADITDYLVGFSTDSSDFRSP